MGSRERKRAERQKRKTRRTQRKGGASQTAASHASAAASQTASGPPTGTGAGDGVSTPESASERRNREAREALEPLREGERPAVVTVAAALCTLAVALSVLGYALWDVLRPDEVRPRLGGVAIFVATVGAMAWGLWKARYWAVLGFQTALVFVIVISAVGLISSLSVLLAVGNLVLLALAGVLFYFMIKAWARIQMPSRLPRD